MAVGASASVSVPWRLAAQHPWRQRAQRIDGQQERLANNLGEVGNSAVGALVVRMDSRRPAALAAESLFEKYQAASRLSIKRVIATYTKVSLVVGNSS